MEKILVKIKQAWRWFKRLTKSNAFIFYYPLIAFTLVAAFPPNLFGFVLLLVWVAVVCNNSDDES
jgi:uncharacterized membrane protein